MSKGLKSILEHKMQNIVIIDSHYLCWRGFYTTGRLTFNGNATGVLYAFFRDIMSIQELFNPDIIVFCFEGSGKRIREDIYPDYKKTRTREYTDEEMMARDGLRMQIDILREDVLPGLGFKNIFTQDRYEADDIIAAICLDRTEDDITIISGDSDLYQLIRKGVRIYNPRNQKKMSKTKFCKQFGIKPQLWPIAKSIIGDKSDNIKGVNGVGEVGAIKYVRGELSENSANMKKIKKSRDVIDLNLKLIQLPFKGTVTPKIVEHEIMDIQVWSRNMERFGIKTLNRKESNEQKPEGFKF